MNNKKKNEMKKTHKLRCPKHGRPCIKVISDKPLSKKYTELFYCPQCDCFYKPTPFKNLHHNVYGSFNNSTIYLTYFPNYIYPSNYFYTPIKNARQRRRIKQEDYKIKKDETEQKVIKRNSLYNKIETRNISISNFETDNVFTLMNKVDIVKKIQLIKNSYNHVTMKHRIEDREINIIFYIPSKHKFSSFKILMHYCHDCNMYFDFYESFKSQIERHDIKIHNIITSCIDDNKKVIHVEENKFNKLSKLKKLGYHVGLNGLSRSQRQLLLSKIISEELMSSSEIKNHLEFLIRYQKNSHKQRFSILCWEEDINFINEYVLKKQNTSYTNHT